MKIGTFEQLGWQHIDSPATHYFVCNYLRTAPLDDQPVDGLTCVRVVTVEDFDPSLLIQIGDVIAFDDRGPWFTVYRPAVSP